MGKAIQFRRDWIGVDWNRPLKVLDYACGTGAISRALAPYVTKLVGIDLSEEMIAKYNENARTDGFDASKMTAVLGNLTDPKTATAEPFGESSSTLTWWL